jgi:glutathione S-transferase
MEPVRVFGAAYSVYVRTVRLALHEKGVAYDLVPVDVFAPGGPPAEHLERQPFGKIPAFEHGSFRLYETGAISRYIDEAFAGPVLQPGTPQERARINQVISIADNYIYPHLVWGVHAELVAKPQRGIETNQARLAASLDKSVTCLEALARLLGDAPFLAGSAAPTLADLHAAPMFHYFRLAPEGRDMMTRWPSLSDWWSRIDARPSMQATRPG